MIERAFKLNPKAPSITGFHLMVDHAVGRGRRDHEGLHRAHGEIAEKEARSLKQTPLLREEIGHTSKADGSGHKKQDNGTGPGKGST